MSNLSLLVDCKKMIQWLQERKKLMKDWYNYVKAAEEKIKILLKEHDDFSRYPELKQIIEENIQNFCFYDVNNFVGQLLKTNIAQQKSIIFGYSDKRVKQWTNLKKFMQSKNVGLLNNAKFIQQSLKFDLPALDKTIEMMDVQLVNLRRKIDFNENTIFGQQNEMKKQVITVGLQIPENINLRSFNIQHQIPIIIAKLPQTIRLIQSFVQNNKIGEILTIYKQKVQKDGLKCQLALLQYFIANLNDYVDVQKGLIGRQVYQNEDKYKEFINWKAVNEWQITIEGDNPSIIEQLKLNYTTLVQDRQSRQEILYNLNQLMFFFIGLKFQSADSNKKIKLQVDQINLTEGQVQKIVDCLQSLINILNSKRLLTPLELKNNKKSYQYFIMKFHNIEKNIQTLQYQIQDCRKQIQNIQTQRNTQVQKLRRFRRKLTSVKQVQEKMLTDFIGKEVKIVGEINKLD